MSLEILIRKAIVKSVVFYSLGYGIVLIAYLFSDHTYAHGPYLHHVLIFYLGIFGSIWFVISSVLYLFKESKGSLAYVLIHGTHTAIIVGIIFSYVS